ncbi:peptidoglycan-binding domain-containing protein [Limobrevibacterium gyesilva]|nr:peptidoglycan-binding domain-containing protein [Limobrevibacterium gyesilva]
MRYDRQRTVWLSLLRGPAADEANRSPGENIAAQRKLQELGLLPAEALIDGVFGTATRTAISSWQQKAGRPVTGFIGQADASALLAGPAPAAQATPTRKSAAAVVPVEYKGPPARIASGDLEATLQTETSSDPSVCQNPKGGLLGIGEAPPALPSCRAIMLRLRVAAKETYAAALGLLDGQTAIDSLSLRIAIRRLDPSTSQPQVVVTTYSGGAHCCTLTAAITQQADGSWLPIVVGQEDGDFGYEYLDPVGDGYSVLVSTDGSFNYHFSSYAGSFPPNRIERLAGSAIEDVTRDPRYRPLLRERLRKMEQDYGVGPRNEPNGFLAGWVAQKALVGELDSAWRAMLGGYVAYPEMFSITICAIDKRVWPKTGYPMCPRDQELRVPFPEALALFLVDGNYITPEQSTKVGYDTVKILADRASAIAIATAKYEERMSQTWYLMTRAWECVQASTPSSPADAIRFDRANGKEDTVHVLQSDETGKPIAVRVDTPMPGNLVSLLTFYRGADSCERERQRRERELENLK